MTFAVAVLMLAAHAYIVWRTRHLLKNLRIHSWIKAMPFILLFSFYLYPLYGLIYQGIVGDVNMLALSHPLSYWFWFGLIFSFQWLTWLIIIDLIRWGARLISKIRSTKVDVFYQWAFIILPIILFLFTAAKMIHDTRSIQIEHISYSSPQVTSGFDGFRIVHISDIHSDEYTGRKRIARYINKINALHPDLVVFTGDLISYGTHFIDMAAQELSRAKATDGIYAVIGDHDYWAGALKVKTALKNNGIHVLQDRNTFIRARNDSLLLTGITEVYSKHIPRDSLRMLTQQYSGMPLKILASHQPTEKVIHQAKNARYQLLLAGHTHGGQLRIPFLFMTFSAAELDTRYLSGVFHFGSLLMNVNNGLGFTLAPVRYNAPPDISVIDLKSK